MYSSIREMKESKFAGYGGTNSELLQVLHQVCERKWFALIHNIKKGGITNGYLWK